MCSLSAYFATYLSAFVIICCEYFLITVKLTRRRFLFTDFWVFFPARDSVFNPYPFPILIIYLYRKTQNTIESAVIVHKKMQFPDDMSSRFSPYRKLQCFAQLKALNHTLFAQYVPDPVEKNGQTACLPDHL